MISEQLKQVPAAAELYAKISEKRARLGVLGLGYVGLPLAAEFAKAGFDVTGFDLSQEKVDLFNQGHSYIKDVPDTVFSPLVKSGRLRATTDFSLIRELDAVDICVPTPLRKTKDPDMSFIVAATESIAAHLHEGMLVLLESTTYPGTTDELVLPKLNHPVLRSAATSSSASRLSGWIRVTLISIHQIFLKWWVG